MEGPAESDTGPGLPAALRPVAVAVYEVPLVSPLQTMVPEFPGPPVTAEPPAAGVQLTVKVTLRVAVSVAVTVPATTFTPSCPSPGVMPVMVGLGGMASWKLNVPCAASCQPVVEPPGR